MLVMDTAIFMCSLLLLNIRIFSLEKVTQILIFQAIFLSHTSNLCTMDDGFVQIHATPTFGWNSFAFLLTSGCQNIPLFLKEI